MAMVSDAKVPFCAVARNLSAVRAMSPWRFQASCLSRGAGTDVSMMLQLCKPTQISDAKNTSNPMVAGQEQLISPRSFLYTVVIMTSES